MTFQRRLLLLLALTFPGFILAVPAAAQTFPQFSAPIGARPFAQAGAQTQVPSKSKPLPKASIKVWVNTASSVYHCPGSRWYGVTKNGQYMSESEAKQGGNRPAYGRTCG